MILFLCLCLGVLAIINAQPIPTEWCSIAFTGDIAETQRVVNDARIACEGEQFKGFSCSIYWASNNYLQDKLYSFAECSQSKRLAFIAWAGSAGVEGAFTEDYEATLLQVSQNFSAVQALLAELHAALIQHITTESTTTIQQLESAINASASSDRANVSATSAALQAFIFAVENQTRTLISQAGIDERAKVLQQEETTRDAVEQDGLQSRSNATSEEQITRNYVVQTENETSALFSKEMHSIVGAFDQLEEEFIAANEKEENATCQLDSREKKDIAKEVVISEADLQELFTHQERISRKIDARTSHFTRHHIEDAEEETRELSIKEEASILVVGEQQHKETRQLVTSSNIPVVKMIIKTSNETRVIWNNGTATLTTNITTTSGGYEDVVTEIASEEESVTRNLYIYTEAQTMGDVRKQDELTQHLTASWYQQNASAYKSDIEFQTTTTQSDISATENITQQLIVNLNTSGIQWTHAAANIEANLARFKAGIPTSLFDTIEIHRNLLNTFKLGFPAVDVYSRSGKFYALRSVVEEAISYNVAKYGCWSPSCQSVAEYWADGEAKRARSLFREAVEAYSAAYYYAVTPDECSD